MIGWYKAGYKENGTKERTDSFDMAKTKENIKSGEKHSTIFGKIARYFADLKTVAFTGSYSDLSGRSLSMPASDVPAWVKADSKQSYAWNETGSKPLSYPPSSHTHGDCDTWNGMVERDVFGRGICDEVPVTRELPVIKKATQEQYWKNVLFMTATVCKSMKKCQNIAAYCRVWYNPGME